MGLCSSSILCGVVCDGLIVCDDGTEHSALPNQENMIFGVDISQFLDASACTVVSVGNKLDA